MNKSIFILCFMLLVFVNCSNSVDSNQNHCDQEIIIDPELYETAPNDDFRFRDIEIVGDCLKITIEYGGGCGNVEVKLIDAGVVMESNPGQRKVRVSLKDEDFCEALIVKEISVDLTPIRIIDDNRVYLNISNWSRGGILYTY